MASMGVLLTLAILFTLFATLVFLPALMTRIGAATTRESAP
jgi:predicted RND superfamily exporter protein